MRYINWRLRTIRFTALLLIASAILTPRSLYSQFSDSTIREINERLLELHECRQKNELYQVLAVNDGLLIARQDSIIEKLTIATNKGIVAKNRFKNIAAFTTGWLVLLLIL